ncbi:hypothetical protein, partial [Bifidobacterium longum]|uniref:hypothetical protein n=1 Tax=Bifidobacterium longum TaxID=216816 RepID=UPI001E29F8E5
NDVVSIPPNYPTSTTTPPDPLTHTKQRKALIDVLNHSVLQGLLRKMAIYQQFSKSSHDGRL